MSIPLLHNLLQPLSGEGDLGFDDVFGSALGDEFAAAVAAFWTHVEEVITAFDDVEVVFDDEDGVALLYETLEHLEETSDVVEVETSGRFVEDVEGTAG